MSGSFEAVRWNACAHRPYFCLYSHQEGVLAEQSQTPREKSPLPEAQRGLTRDTPSRRTASLTHYRLSYSGPRTEGLSTADQPQKEKSTAEALEFTHAHKPCWLVACLTSQQHASVFQRWICSDNCTCCHTETEVAKSILPKHRGHMCLSTHVVVRDGQVCYVSMGNLVSMLVDIYLYM